MVATVVLPILKSFLLSLSLALALITVLHRASSDTSNLPAGIKKIEVEVLNENVLIEPLHEIDITM